MISPAAATRCCTGAATGTTTCWNCAPPTAVRHRLTGGELLQVFRDAGGFSPQLVFLTACLSGTLVDAKDWAEFRQAMLRDAPPWVPAAGRDPAAALTFKQPQVPSGGRDLQERQLHDLMQEQPGYTGTALALLAAGVPQVVAMRYEVGDDYARELARAFYRHLLADPAGHSPETALALARGELFRQPDQSAFSPVDHCTPLFFGNTARPLVAAHGASRQMERRSPQPWPLLSAGSRELDPAPPQGFVGRGAELSRLAERRLPRPSDASPAAGAAVAVVQGLAGLGKTALAGEGIHLWHGQFKYVLCFQAKPTPLQVDEFAPSRFPADQRQPGVPRTLRAERAGPRVPAGRDAESRAAGRAAV